MQLIQLTERMSAITTCKRCFGAKKVIGLGGMYTECPDCKVVSVTTVAEKRKPALKKKVVSNVRS